MYKIKANKAVLAVALLAALILSAILVKQYVSTPKPPPYLTAKVVRGNIESAVMTTGTLQAFRQVDVGSRVSGQLKSLKVKLGDHVVSGQLLAEIDPVLSQNALLSAKANMESLVAQRHAAAASLQQADLAYQRQQAMIKEEATSRQELEAAKAQSLVTHGTLASLDAQILQAKTQVDSAAANLNYTQITAPMSGDVVAIVTQEGQTVVASQQAPVILKLANLDVMTVKALISEADVTRIQAGQTAYFTTLGNAAERHYGKLASIDPAPQDYLSTDTKTAGPIFYNALFNAPNPDHGLRIAMTAQVTVVLSEAKNALYVPISALGKAAADGRYPVHILGKNGKNTTSMISAGISDNVRMQVVDGLKEGDEVIIEEVSAKDASTWLF
ncbi:MAG: macrolide transporter subunit MacA [Methylophilaceae bacterium]|nr:macrolide transporter subunit MacA [Methylophilaceae bacterium]